MEDNKITEQELDIKLEEKTSNKKKNKSTKNFSTAETILLVIIGLVIGLSIGALFSKTDVITKENVLKDKYLKEFINNYEFILNNYYEEVDRELLINSAISGMMDSLDDPYSMYFNEDESSNFSATLNGSYKGLGVEITKDQETGYMLVASVFKDSPASQAGLKAGDKIVSIDKSMAKDMSASEFSALIRNSNNKEFNLKIIRDNNDMEIKLSKQTITLNSILSKTFELENKKVGYIYIGIFANNTYEQFKKELDKLEKDKIDALIIDVRGNTGGHLTAVDSILDEFLNSSQIMYQFDQNGKVTSTYGTGKNHKDYEIVLLGNETSASASEVLIAGLRENLNSKLIGKKTYGKGTVQELVTLSDGTQYKITVKKWLTPKGTWINDNNGIVPDIEIDLSDNYYSNYSDDNDTQLQRALNYLKDGQ